MSKLLKMQGIRKGFYGVEVLHDVHLELEKGEIRALCGENGAGKSTLMKVLSGIHEQEAGDVYFKDVLIKPNAGPLEVQGCGISMIHQELNLFDDLSVAQNIFLCREPRKKNGLIDFSEMNRQAEKLLQRLGESIDPKIAVRELKIAQKQMVEIAKAISFNVELLIMDEPTAVLTGKETEIMFSLMRNLSSEGIAIIYISHRLKEIKEVCDTVTILRDGEFIGTRNVSEVTEKDIASLMVGREIQESRQGDFSGDEDDVVLEVRNVSDGLLNDVSFKVRKGEILCFSGLVGAGRTELMEVIFGMRTPRQGEILLEGKPVTVKSAIKIRCSGDSQSVSNLSGGNQQKVALAKWLLSDARVLILDEPTRGVDIGARQEIYQIINELAAGGLAVIIVSSDMQEVMSVSQKVAVMHEGRLTGELKSSELDESKIMYLATNV